MNLNVIADKLNFNLCNMKYSILVFTSFLFSISAVCQNDYNLKSSGKYQTQINALGEIGGNGIYLSMGFEQANFEYKVLKSTFRGGFSLLEYLVFGEYNFDFGTNKNYFELGVGPSLSYTDNSLNLYLFGRIGYRYISDTFIFRAAFTPFLGILNGADVYPNPYFGVSLGFPIKRNKK